MYKQQMKLNSSGCLPPGDFITVTDGVYCLADKQTNDVRFYALGAEAEAKVRVCTKIGF